MQFAVILLEDDLDTVEDRPNRHGGTASRGGTADQTIPPCRAGARVRPVGAQPATGAGARGTSGGEKERAVRTSEGESGGWSGGAPSALVDRAAASGRAIRVTPPPVRGAVPEATTGVGGGDGERGGLSQVKNDVFHRFDG